MKSSKKLKIITVVGTRPEIIRLSRILSCFDKNFDHILVNTNQNYDYTLNKIFFEDLRLKKPKYLLNCSRKNNIETICDILNKTYKIFLKEKPDAVVVLGDTNSALSVISAKKLKIPVFHLEAGNRCFDQRVPEEINRKIIDHISDFNFTYSEMARQNLYRENISADTIFKIGSPLYEVINFNYDKIKSSKVLKKLKINKNNFFLFSFHREENIENNLNLNKIVEIIRNLHKIYKLPIFISTHPRTRKKLGKEITKFPKEIKFLQPLGYFDYMNLQLSAKLVLSDSGSIIEESNILDFPAICLRETNERQEGIEMGTVVMQMKYQDIINSIEYFKNINFLRDLNNKSLNDYSNENVSQRVLFLVKSYIEYANTRFWFKK
jgi:UDP-N-acetylglucosamine 2-epimerase (non-hydrolysing)